MWAARSACETWVNWASEKDVTEMPIAEPMLRNRLSNAAPSPRKCGASVVKASTVSGLNTKPMPRPCTTMVTISRCSETSGVHRLMS